MKIVTVNGCFDILHSGHLDLLQFAKSQGDYLIVLLNSDASVKRLKGKGRPINNQKDRKRMLEAIRCVDEVMIFTEDTPLKSLRILRPEINVKSKGAIISRVQKEKELMDTWGGKVVFFTPNNNKSSTKLIEVMKK